VFLDEEVGDAVTSQGQRFRRRALRRGYKVDEVDSFLDRVEATLAGEHTGAPVGAQEVHDVVFRVRFGGYDEWQVDLHLDRVERQLAELEERGGRPDPRMAGRTDSGMPSGRMSDSMGGGRMSDSMGGGRMSDSMGGGRMDPRMDPRMDSGMGQDRMPDRMQPDRMGPPPMNRASPPTERLPAPIRDDRPMSPPPAMPQRPAASMPAPDPYGGRYDEPYGQPAAPPPAAQGYDTGSYDAFEPGRHGKTDMTAEIRMPERDNRDRDSRDRGYGGAPMGGPSPMSAPPMPSSPMSGPPTGGPGGGEAHRVDQLRRTFQPRRFGSGYDPNQVDRLFEGILSAMSGRGPMPVSENELDTLQFGLVPGGYFEPEVDAALREVKDILRRR
jgi:DivIVA domain-containing protein